MQADDFQDKEYHQESVYYFIAVESLDIITIHDCHYVCPIKYVLMSKHPFLKLHIELLSQILEILRFEWENKEKLLKTI